MAGVVYGDGKSATPLFLSWFCVLKGLMGAGDSASADGVMLGHGGARRTNELIEISNTFPCHALQDSQCPSQRRGVLISPEGSLLKPHGNR